MKKQIFLQDDGGVVDDIQKGCFGIIFKIVIGMVAIALLIFLNPSKFF